ncbi:MAG: archaemetzincin family Zn-dependent metalloprotease [Desulfobacterales bacterium]|nr:archaemetzincin family Zn-dependent metalloprotease [Desulfobacterales bacterium]
MLLNDGHEVFMLNGLKEAPNCVTIRPIGPVEEYILEYLSEFIAERCNIKCLIDSEIEIPEFVYNKTRDQYNSKLIIKHLIENHPVDTNKFIGVTNIDLFIPILKYVFGIAQIEGNYSIISTHRLYPEFYDKPSNPGLFIERTKKTALHEIGHTFGLTHCRDLECVMHSSARIKDTDIKSSFFCPTCSDLFKWYSHEKYKQAGQIN